MLDNKVKRTLKTMLKGSLIYNFVLLILSIVVSILFCHYRKYGLSETAIFTLKICFCIIVGFLTSIFWIYSMATTIEKAVSSNDEKYTRNYMIFMSMIRLFIFSFILVIIINVKFFGLVCGIMFTLATLGVKVGAYLVPIIKE